MVQNRYVRDGSPDGWATLAADYAARGGLDDAFLRTASAAGIGLVSVGADGTVWWSDEAYRLHGRPRWRRVRTLGDLAWGLKDPAAVRAAYSRLLTDADVDLHYSALGERGEHRDLALLALDRGVAAVHRADAATPPSSMKVPLVAKSATIPPTIDGAQEYAAPAPEERAAAPSAAAGSTATVGAEVSADTDHHELAAAVLSSSPDLVLLYDLDTNHVVSMAGNVAWASDLVDHLASGGAIRDSVHPDDLPALQQARVDFAHLVDGEVRHIDARFVDGEGWSWYEIRASAFRRHRSGALREAVLLVRDVHERVEANLRLAASERAFRELFEASPVGLAVLDDHGRFADVNDSFCRLAGRTRTGIRDTSYVALLHPQDRAAAEISRARRLADGGTSGPTDRRLVRADGSVIWVRVRTSDLELGGDLRTLVSLEDVTASKATEDQLRHDALHDELTGLPNRRLLLDRLERAIARSHRSGSRLAVFFIDLDDLKRVNDNHPWKHRAGDVLLTSMASSLREAMREADTLGRLGGDEFVAICEDLPDDATVNDIAERILLAATKPLVIGQENITPGASVGVAVTGDEDETADALIRRADSAMFTAKSAGGSRIAYADATTSPPSLALDLSGALVRGELAQHYQPVVSLSTGAAIGVMSVVRWREGERDGVDDVRELLETSSAAVPVVQWSIQRAVDDVRMVAPTRVDHVSVWLPIPARAALSSATRAAVLAAVHGPDGSLDIDTAPSLVLDVHERDVTSLTRRLGLHEQLDELLESGPLALGVDHFTASKVPLGLLQQLAAASISLDALLLTDAARNPGTAEVVHALVTAAAALGVVSIAMDVESQDQLDLARQLGVHAAYGDLLGPPAPLEDYSDLLHGGRLALPAPVPLPLDDDEFAGDEPAIVEEYGDPADPSVHDDQGLPDEHVVSDEAWAALLATHLGQDARGLEAHGDVDLAPTRTPEPTIRVVPSPAETSTPEPEPEPVDVPVTAELVTTEPVIDQPVIDQPVIQQPAPVIGGIGDDLAASMGYEWLGASAEYRAETPTWTSLTANYPAASDSPVWDALLREPGQS